MNPESKAISSVIEKTDISLLREVKDSLELADQVRDALERYKKETGQRGRAIEVKYTYPKKYTAQREFFEQYCRVKSALSTEVEKIHTPETLEKNDWTVIKSAVNERIRLHDLQLKPAEPPKAPRQNLLSKLWSKVYGIFKPKAAPVIETPIAPVQPDIIITPAPKSADEEETGVGTLAYCLDAGGNIQSPMPLKIVRIQLGPDGRKYAFFEETGTGWPLDQLEFVVFDQKGLTPEFSAVPVAQEQPQIIEKPKPPELASITEIIEFVRGKIEAGQEAVFQIPRQGLESMVQSSIRSLPLPFGIKIDEIRDNRIIIKNGQAVGIIKIKAKKGFIGKDVSVEFRLRDMQDGSIEFEQVASSPNKVLGIDIEVKIREALKRPINEILREQLESQLTANGRTYHINNLNLSFTDTNNLQIETSGSTL